MNKTIEIAGFIPASAADGPGIRSVLFLQGCSQFCPDCHNASFQEHGQGILYPIDKLVNYIVTHCKTRKLTISGGEPMEQLEQLNELIHLLVEKDFNLCLYTSYEYEMVPDFILKQIHYLKTGPFLREYINPPKPFVGSNNQKFYHILRKDGEICLLEI